MAGREQRVTPLELFFDLVFVYAITQVTLLMSDDPTWQGLGRGMLVLAALWWLGIVVIAALWWAYLDVYAVLAQRQLSETGGATRARLARDCYSYLHLPMIAGVLFALGLKKTIEQFDETLATVPAVALCGGLSLYFLTHVALRVRLVHFVRQRTTEGPGWIGPGRLATGIGMLALLPAALEVSALIALALVAALCCALIAWDVVYYRDHRTEVRQARP
jgi:low temperature requirement protein LtrA